MRIRTIAHHFREAFVSLRRNGLMSLASIGTVSVALLILGSAVLLVLNANNAVGSAEDQLQMTVIVQEDATEDMVQDLEVAINQIPHVTENKFVSKVDGLNELKESFEKRQDVLEFGDNNPLPDTFRVKVDTSENVTKSADQIKQLAGVDDVKYPLEVVKKLLVLTKWIRLAGAVLVILLGLAAIFLISTTIRLTVFARRKEIGIMKFLGATDWFIRSPFVLEGVGLGFAGALIAIGILYLSYMSLLSVIQNAVPFIPLQSDVRTMLLLMESLLGIGVFIGALGSFISVRKFLKV